MAGASRQASGYIWWPMPSWATDAAAVTGRSTFSAESSMGFMAIGAAVVGAIITVTTAATTTGIVTTGITGAAAIIATTNFLVAGIGMTSGRPRSLS